MKKRLAALLSLTLLAGLLSGCGAAAGPERLSVTDETPERVTVCIESSFQREALNLISYMATAGYDGAYQLMVLPTDPEERAEKIAAIQADIAAGQGPDVFVLETHTPLTVDPPQPLFENPEKAMYDGAFLDLSPYVEDSEIIDLTSCNPYVMQTGTANGGRFLLPLLYTYPVMGFDRENLQDPDFSFTTLEELAASDEEALKEAYGCSLNFHAFTGGVGKFANYAKKQLLLTEEAVERLQAQVDALQPDPLDYPDSYVPEDPMNWHHANTFTLQNTDGRDCALFPMPNQRGGVTANVVLYAAVNRNTDCPETAFRFAELLLSDELQSGTGFPVGDGRYVCTFFCYGNAVVSGLPVKDSLLLEHTANTATSAKISRAAMEDMAEISRRINAARIPSELDDCFYRCGIRNPDVVRECLVAMEEIVKQ